MRTHEPSCMHVHNGKSNRNGGGCAADVETTTTATTSTDEKGFPIQ